MTIAPKEPTQEELYTIWEARAMVDIDHVEELIKSPRSSEPRELAVELDNLNQWLPRIGELLSEAKSAYESALGAMIVDLYKDPKYMQLATSLFKQVAEGRCADILKIFLRIDKLYASLVHCIESVRSLLSFAKEDMKMTPHN